MSSLSPKIGTGQNFLQALTGSIPTQESALLWFLLVGIAVSQGIKDFEQSIQRPKLEINQPKRSIYIYIACKVDCIPNHIWPRAKTRKNI